MFGSRCNRESRGHGSPATDYRLLIGLTRPTLFYLTQTQRLLPPGFWLQTPLLASLNFSNSLNS